MIHWRSALLALGWAAAAAFAGAPVSAQTRADAHRSEEVILKLRPGATPAERQAILTGLGAVAVRPLAFVGAEVVRIAAMPVEQAVFLTAAHPAVEFVEPNFECRILAAPDDSLFEQLWGMRNLGQTHGTPGADVRAALAWDVTTGSRDVLVAIIDTGVDYTHPDLAPNMYVNPGEIPGNGIDDDANGFVDDVRGWDFDNLDNDPIDDHGHGTHCAGTVGAVGNNRIGVAGLCWQVTLLPLKFLGYHGRGTIESAVRAIEYATLAGADVMSNSWSGGGYSQALHDAIREAHEAGIVFVAAAGNSTEDNDAVPVYPSGYDLPNIVSVAATDHDDRLATFSNYGRETVDLAAPGDRVLSTAPDGGYAVLSGTSMAAPHVAGAFALMFARYPGMAAAAAIQGIFAEVEPLPALAGRMTTGGRLNAYRPLADRDSIAPAPVADLVVAAVEARRVTLEWTATGDDGRTGAATGYDVRYSTSPITPATFDSAARTGGLLAPRRAGERERLEIGGLSFSTPYYFAIRVEDDWGNQTTLSNLASGTTLGPPEIELGPTEIVASLLTGASRTQTLTIENRGVGELNFDVFTSGRRATLAAPARAGVEQAAPRMELPPPSTVPFAAGPAAHSQPIAPPVAAPQADAAEDGLRILILKRGAHVSEIRALLASYPGIAAVDTLDVAFVLPTLDQLRPYDATLMVISYPVSNRAEMGDVLADYVDLGRGLVLTLPSFIRGYQLEGRLLDEGYVPFEVGTGPIGSSTLATFEPEHPIMAGVAGGRGDLVCDVVPRPDAQVVATWQNGKPCVATRGDRVVAVNAFYGWSGYWSGDLALMLHNAALWTTQTARWIDATPRRGVVPSQGRLDLVVTLDAAGLAGGSYEGTVLVQSDDPDEGVRAVTTRLSVVGAPDLAVESAPVALESAADYAASGASTSHSLAAGTAFAGPAAIELVAEGAFGTSTRTATASVEGTTVGRVGGAGPECGPVAGTFPLGGAFLAEILADGRIEVTVRNTGDVGADCPVNRHRVRFLYAPSIDPLDFGEVAVGSSRERALVIRNRGTEELIVYGAFTDRQPFTTAGGAAKVAPGAAETLAVRFAPTRTGVQSGAVVIASNDPDASKTRIALSGEGIAEPPLAVVFDLETEVIRGSGRHGPQWIEAHIDVAPPHSAAAIVRSSIRLNGVLGLGKRARVELEDRDRDGIPERLEVRFRRRDLALILAPGDSVPVVVTGRIGKTATFEGRDWVRVERGKVRKHHPHGLLAVGQVITLDYDLSGDPAESVALLGSTDGGESWSLERTGLPNLGSIAWRVPEGPAREIRLAVVEIAPGRDLDEVIQVLGVSEPFAIGATTAVEELPEAIALALPTPNPAPGPVTVRYALPQSAAVALRIYDLQGRAVRTLHRGIQAAGRHELRWDRRSDGGALLGPGVYFVRLETGSALLTRSVVLLH